MLEITKSVQQNWNGSHPKYPSSDPRYQDLLQV